MKTSESNDCSQGRSSAIKSFYIDLGSICALRMKLIRKDRVTLTVMISALILFAYLVLSLTEAAQEESSIPIGIVNYDDSADSRELINRLEQVPALKVIEKEEEELNKLLLDEMITTYFVIHEDYSRKLQKGDLHEVLSMYYVKDNKSASVISDIIAGEMMYSVCYYKGLKYYLQLPGELQKHSMEEYQSYMTSLWTAGKDFDFAFQTILLNPEKQNAKDLVVPNSVIYHQLVFGILGILISFIAMFMISGFVWEKENGIGKRLNVSRIQSIRQDMGNFLAVMLMEGILCLLFAIIMIMQFGVQRFGSLYLLMIGNALCMAGWFMLLTKWTKSIVIYQLASSAMILIGGGLGFYRLLSGFYPNFIQSFVKIIPNSWFIEGFTDIMIYGSGYQTKGHTVLFIMAAIAIFLVIIIDQIIVLGQKIRKSK